MPDTTPALLSPSARSAAVRSPIIPTINGWVRQHPGTISLGQGVAFFSPPQEALAAVEDRLHEKQLDLYGPVQGIPELVVALRHKLEQKNQIRFDQGQEIFVTAGSNMAFSSLMLALLDPDDEVILLTPFYFNHEMAITLANAKAVLTPALDNFHPDLDAIKNNITARTKAIVTVSPNNPSAAVYSQEELTEINQLCEQHGLYHISDEAYEDFVFEDTEHFSAASLNNSAAHTISLYSFSKAYGFAGWRVGYMLVPAELADTLRKVQDTVLISPPIVSQLAALGALQADTHYLQTHLNEIKNSRALCLQALNDSGVLRQRVQSEGAFYIFARIQSRLSDLETAHHLIRENGVATIPGSAFATEGYLRISYGALTSDNVDIGMQRLIKGLQQLA